MGVYKVNVGVFKINPRSTDLSKAYLKLMRINMNSMWAYRRKIGELQYVLSW